MKYENTYVWLENVCARIRNQELGKLFRSCFLSTLTTTVREKEDGTTYVLTGDIPAMWLRDSSSQVNPYVRLCAVDADMKTMVRGVLARQFFYIGIDPYANAFNEAPNGHGHKDITERNDWVWERKFEIDSLCYPLWLSEKYYAATGDVTLFDARFRQTVQTILDVFETEQHHAEKSAYTFMREGHVCDTLENNGRGGACRPCGLVWSAFRPSDDKNHFAYLIPSNMFIVSVMRFLIRVFTEIAPDPVLEKRCKRLKTDVEKGLRECATTETEEGCIYVYEADGLGNCFIADDANMPSLLSIPYFTGNTNDPVYASTRKYLLSSKNRYYYEGKYARGIGSPHTPENYIWHLGLIVQGLTAESPEEKTDILRMLMATHSGTYHMHEGFHKDNPTQYTREWFGWADSLFAKFVMDNFDLFKDME